MDIDALIAELEAARAALVEDIAELGVLDALPSKPHTDADVVALKTLFERRDRLLARAVAALKALEADGYPELPQVTLSRLEYEDLKRSLRLGNQGLALFEVEGDPVTGVTIIVGTPEPKATEPEIGFLRE